MSAACLACGFEAWVPGELEVSDFLSERKPGCDHVELGPLRHGARDRLVDDEVLDAKIPVEPKVPSDQGFTQMRHVSLSLLVPEVPAIVSVQRPRGAAAASECEPAVCSTALLCVFASSPTSRIPSTMEHGVDEDLHPSNLKKYDVREPTEESSTHRAVHELVGLGMASDRREASVDSS